MSKIKLNKSLDEILGKSKGFLVRLYREIRHKGFNTDVSKYVLDKTKHDDISLGELAEQYGLTQEFQDYINKDIIGGLRGNLSKAYYWTSSVKDGLENMMQGFTATAEAAGAAESAGLSVIVGEGVEIPAELILQGIYNYLASALGWLSGTYTFGKQGYKNYAVDLGTSNLDVIINSVPGPGFLEYFTNLGDPIKSIKKASASRARYWLVQKIKEKNPAADISDFMKEEDLIDRVNILHDKFKKKKLSDNLNITEYGHDMPVTYTADVLPKSYQPI